MGVWVSSLNHCDYCVEHHFAGLQRLLADDGKSRGIRAAIEARSIETAPLTQVQMLAMEYARKLTIDPAALRPADIQSLRDAGFEDGAIFGNQSGMRLFQLCKPDRVGAWLFDQR